MEKTKVTYNIDKKIISQFNETTKKMSFKKSGIIETLITEWIKKQINKK